ncbi:MAG: urease accessory protein [Bacteroidetes bacterium]|nr:MAG: urease accessory protein [Bacteroidota bacterium]
MEVSFSLFFAALVGFGHAFEADHLIAVSNIATKRQHLALAVKDGIFWGLGHTSTILLIGLLIIVGRLSVPESMFSYLEAAVGVMLMVLGGYRLVQVWRFREDTHHLADEGTKHHLAYGVGLVHGLAGSGAMVLLVMSEISSSAVSMLYLLIFGLGSILGMLLAAGLLSLPVSKRVVGNLGLQLVLSVLSSLLCLGYGAWILYENLTQV